MENQTKHFVVAVIAASLNKKGRLGPRTWLRVRGATKLGKSLRRSGQATFQYVIVPSPDSSDAMSRMRLQIAITQRDLDCAAVPTLPALGERVPVKEHIAFVQKLAAQSGASLILC